MIHFLPASFFLHTGADLLALLFKYKKVISETTVLYHTDTQSSREHEISVI